MNNYDKSKWLVMAGIITTTNAMWLPQKRGPEFHNAGDPEPTDHSNKTTKDATQTTDKPKATHTTAKNEPTNDSNHTTAAPRRSSSSPKTASAASASSSSNSSNSSSSSSSSAPTSGAVSSTAIVSSPAPTVMSSSTSVPSLTGSISSSTPSASAAASTGSSGSSSSGAIIGAVVAVLVVAIAGAGALLFVRRRRRRQLKQSRAARMSTMNPNFGVENKPYDHQDNYSAPQTGYNEAPSMQQVATATSNFNTYQPALAINNQSKETIQQQQQQYYQTQSPTAVQPQITEGPQEPQTASLGTFTVIATYIPTLSDELEIEPGDRIELLVEYDDGWCQGINITKNYAKGVFPRHCIDVVDQVAPLPPSSTTDVERTKRVSSMYVTGTSAK